ncbi:tol protein [Colletotrichum asianum]
MTPMTGLERPAKWLPSIGMPTSPSPRHQRLGEKKAFYTTGGGESMSLLSR